MSFGRLGKLGNGFGRLGAGTKATTAGGGGGGTAGQPMGLLLILTYPA